MKKRLPIIIMIILTIACMFVLTSCSEGVSPVESIIISTLPKTTYYKGDAFSLNNAEITVYYQNGKAEIVPLDLTMVSNFDAQLVGEQILTVSYGDQTKHLKITVSDAPIHTIELGTKHKTEYVQGQALDTSNMTISVTYTNGFSEIVNVTDDMITGFDSSILGEQEVILTYSKNGKSINKTLPLKIVRKEMEKIDIIAPDKQSYVVGESLDLTGGAITLYYNDNTDSNILFTDLYGKDSDFKIFVQDEETLLFNQSSLSVLVTVVYYDKSKEFTVRVRDVAVEKLELTRAPLDQIRNGTLDIIAGLVHVIYNNGDTEDLSLNDPRFTNNIKDTEFNINVVGAYLVRFFLQGVALDVELNVIEAKESELIIILPDVIYYQQTGEIDYTTWQYSIKLTNGSLRALDQHGNTKANLSKDEASFVKLDKTFNEDFSTTDVGIKTFKFIYTSVDKRTLSATIDVNIVKKELVSVEYFKTPTVTTYMQGDTLKLDGAQIKFKYNSGEITGTILLTRDMFEDSVWNNATTEAVSQKNLSFTYENVSLETSISHSFNIKVISKVNKVVINSSSSHKTTAIQGTYFDPSNLILDVTYPDNIVANIQNFDANEWTFVNNYFANVGQQEVKVYYGDINDVSNTNFVSIQVTVTNNITNVEFADGYLDDENYGFADIIEEQTVSIGDNAYIAVTYENGDIISVRITSEMLAEAESYNKTIGKRGVKVSYGGFTLMAFVNVLNRKITSNSVRIVNNADKLKYAQDEALSLDGLRFAITYNNNAVYYITLTNGETTYQNGKEKFIFTKTYDETWDPEISFIEKTIYVTVALLINGEMIGGEDTVSYTTYWFDKLPERITLLENDNTLSTVNASEGVNSIIFPKEAVLHIVYANGENAEYYLNDYYIDNPNYLSPDKYSLIGFDSNTVRNQTITFSYLLYDCTFTVNVRSKILIELNADKTSISVIEGMQINSESISITAHYVDAESYEFEDDYGYVKIELSDLVSSYDPNAPVDFVNKKFVTTTVTFSFNGKELNLELIINQKTLESIALSHYPQQKYYEFHSDGLSLKNGKLIASYNNNTSESFELESGISNLKINSFEFDNEIIVELNNGSEVKKNIYISYTVNGVEKTTSYTVNIVDRKYLTVDFPDKSTVRDGAYQLTYGETENSRPHFYVMHGSDIFIANEDIDAKIAEDIGFSVMYRDSIGVETANYPENAGLYTIVIRYLGDKEFNALTDSSMKIRINKRKIYVNALQSEATYGDYQPNFEFEITMDKSDGTTVVLTDNDILTVAYDVYLDGVIQTFKQGVVSLDVSTATREYKIRPKLDIEYANYNNFEIVEYAEAVFTVNPLPIAIVPIGETKVYGQSEPTYRYDVFLYQNFEKGDKIGGKTRIGDEIVANVTINDYIVDISNYNLTRNLNLEYAQDVGEEHEIMPGSSSILSNFSIKYFESGKMLNITKKSITIKGLSDTKEFGQATPDFVFSTLNQNDIVYSANLRIFDTFASVFGEYTSPNNYTLKIYKDTDTQNLNDLAQTMGGKGVPYNTEIGTYRVYIDIDNALIKNYQVAIEPLTLTITKADIKVFALDITTTYGDAEPVYVYGEEGNYWYQFNDGYLLDASDFVCNFTREAGKNVGKYQVSLTQETYTSNSNFNISLYGKDLDTAYSYIYITPRAIKLNHTGNGEETYSKKPMTEFAAPYELKPEDINYTLQSGDINDINNAISFSWKGRTDRVQGTGFAVVDTYDGIMTYDYLMSINFWIINWEQNLAEHELTRINDAINAYILDGTPFDAGEIIELKDNFVYKVNPKPLDIEITNSASYNFDNRDFVLGYNDLTSQLCGADTIKIIPDISVVYQGEIDSVRATSVYNAGIYTIKITDIGNFNYTISNIEYSKVIEIIPIEIKVVIKGVENQGEYYYTHNEYNGERQEPYDTVWINNTSELGAEKIVGEGYFYTESYKIVSSGLADAPNRLTIYPYTVDENGQNVYPTNAGIYFLMVNINEVYKNYSVKFVSPTNHNEEADYKFVIDKRVVNVINVSSYNVQEYNETAPKISSSANIYVENDVSKELINVRTDLTFSFERDMNFVPEYLKAYINEQDNISAGYFKINVNYTKSNNYSFELEGVEHYIIKRKNIEIALNSNTEILNKQYDTLKPTAVASSLSIIGGTASYFHFDVNGVELDINVKAFWNGQTSSWTQSIPENYKVGYYAYDIIPKIKTGDVFTYFAPEDQYDTFIEAGETARKLIDWNHTYTVVEAMSSTLLSYGISEMYPESEGIYQVKRRNVILSVPQGRVESRKINNVATNVYVYYQPYNAKSITYNEVLAFMNGYQPLDENEVPIDASLGFTFRDMTCPTSPLSIVNTEEYYMLAVEDIAVANPNFNILYANVIYEIAKLNVELKLIAKNGDQGSTMIYGTGYSNLTFELDFNDKAAFIAAMGLDILPSELNISDYTSREDNDPLRFFINNNVYQLLNAGGTPAYSTNIANNPNISKGNYTPNVLYMAEYSQNFYFTYVYTIFEVKPKIITINEIQRTYFRDDAEFSYDISNALLESEKSTVNNLLRDVLETFIYISGINIASDAGTFIQGDPNYSKYYSRAIKTNISFILNQSKYINYDIDYVSNDICDLVENGNTAYTYIKIVVKKQTLKVRIAKPDAKLGDVVTAANSISMTFGENLYSKENRYDIYVDGFATLQTGDSQYDYETEIGIQSLVKSAIRSNILRLPELFTRMSTELYNSGKIDTLSLSDFKNDYSSEIIDTNYIIDLDKVYYIINKIDIYLNLKNLGNESSPFEALYTELESFVYSDELYNPERLDMGIEIANPTSIIGYNSGYSLIQLFILMGVYNKSNQAINSIDALISNLEYVITQDYSNYFVYSTIVGSTGKKTTAGVKTSAGEAKIALTNKSDKFDDQWYFSLGYNLICSASDITVYPEVAGLGDRESTNYYMPNSGVALVGVPEDFAANLSMYVKLNYLGNPKMEYEYVDIKISSLRDSQYYPSSYRRDWNVMLKSEISDIKVGNEINMTLEYQETFFSGTSYAKTNTIVSSDFKVRLYELEDKNLILGNSYFTYNTQTYNYGDEISGNHTYTLGTYIQNPTGEYLVKNWRDTNYYTNILPSLRYMYEPFQDINGRYVKVGDCYYLIIAKDRYNAQYSGSHSGSYLEIMNPDECTPQYVEINNDLRYDDVEFTQKKPSGKYLKYTCVDGSHLPHALEITPENRRTRLFVYDLQGQYVVININGVDREIEIKEGENTYTLYKQADDGDHLMMDIYSNIYYMPIVDENRYDKAEFVGSYDILDTRFRIDPNSNISDYYLSIIMFNDGVNDLYIKIDNTGYYLYLGSTLLDSENSIDALDLFDSFSHSVTFYIDKIGSYDIDSELSKYYVIIIIDDCYYLKLDTGNGINSFGTKASYAKVVTNEINITFTKFEAIAMGISTFSLSNYIGDIVFIPSTLENENFKNYSYHITIPTASMEEIDIDVTKLFVLGSINSVFGYSTDNYYFDYLVDGEVIHSTSKTKPVGLPVYSFSRGIYNLTIKMHIKYTGDPTITYYEQVTKTIKLSISQNYSRISLPQADGVNYKTPSVSEPVLYDAESLTTFVSPNTIDINYNKIVFDFTPKENETIYYLRYILKTSDYAVDLLYDNPDSNYYGLMLEHTGTFGNGNNTKIYMRRGETLWTFDLGQMLSGDTDAWIGSRNVLEVLYVENNGYLLVTLSRGMTRIFSQKIYNNCPIGIPNVSKADISAIINTGVSYTAIQLQNAALTIYKYEVGYRMLGAIDFVDNSDNSFISGVSNIESNKKVLISNGDGTAYTSTAKKYYIKFQATALDDYNNVVDEELIRFVVTNNTARLMPMDPYDSSTLTSDRGIYLSIVNKSKTERELRMYMYKYNKIYRDQIIFTFDIGSDYDLLNGKEHFIEVDMSFNDTHEYTVENVIECYRMSVNIGYDGKDIEGKDKTFIQSSFAYYPVKNDMSGWTLITDSPIKDEEVDDGNKDTNFVSNVVYSGIITINSTILVKELSIC